MRALRISVFVLSALVPSPSPAEEKWLELSTDNFVLVTNAAEGQAASVLQRAESFRDALGRLLPELRLSTSRRVRLYGFRDSDSLEPFLAASERTASRVTGFFRQAGARNLIAVDLSAAFERVLYHEYLHLVLRLREHRFPLWFEEGLSEFYSNTEVGRGGVTIGHADPQHRGLLSHEPLVPLEELLRAEGGASPGHEDPGRLPVFYAESWALVHYLLTEAPGGQERLARYLGRFHQGAEPMAAFVEIFGDPRALEDAVREYVRGGSFRGIRLAAGRAAPEVRARALSMAEVQHRWGELFLLMGRLAEARVCLAESLRLDPSLGETWEALAFLALEQGREEEARIHFRRASELEGASAAGLYRYASLLVGAGRDLRLTSVSDPVYQEAASLLRRSLSLEPSAREPAELLVFLHLVRGDHLEEAETLLETALALVPGETSLLYLKGQLLARKGEYGRARSVLSRVIRESRDSRLRQSAGEFLSSLDALERAR